MLGVLGVLGGEERDIGGTRRGWIGLGGVLGWNEWDSRGTERGWVEYWKI